MQPQFQHFLDQLFAFGSDFLPFIVLTVLIILFSLYFGRERLAPLIAALYAALGLYMAFPYMPFIANPLMQVGLYIILAILTFLTFSGLSYFMAAHSGSLITTVAFAVITAGAILAISIHVLPVQQLYSFTPATKTLFDSNQAYFWWLVAPLAGLFFLGR